MSLTAKQEAFCQNIASGKTQYESYKLAYNTSKMKRDSIDQKASELAKNVKVTSRIEELKKPQQDLLEANRNAIIQKAIDLAVKSENPQVLNKLLDKLIATKTDLKAELNIRTIEDVINEL